MSIIHGYLHRDGHRDDEESSSPPSVQEDWLSKMMASGHPICEEQIQALLLAREGQKVENMLALMAHQRRENFHAVCAMMH